MATLFVPDERAALATNLLSAACTAGAGAIAARLVARWTGSVAMGLAAALAAGAMSTVWLNATETEVYATALLLVMTTLWAADRAEQGGGARSVVLVAYLIALAPALHLIALLAAPAAILLASSGVEGRPARRVGVVLSLVFVVAAGVGRGSIVLVALGAASLAALAILAMLAPRPAAVEDRAIAAGAVDRSRRRLGIPAGALLAAVVALSALAVLSVRAAHDPALNQGDPSTLARLLDVVARRQYDVAPLFPRQAPLWLQGVNVLQYADWQVALGVAPGVTPSVPRTVAAVLWLAIGVVGSLAHRRRHRRSWRALALLGLAGSVGALLYLNLKAGPSIGWGILPDAAPHEARERDYFFVFGFWAWGLWAGIGSVELASRLASRARLAAAGGVALAALPIALNWNAVDRTREPEASIARTAAVAVLRGVPERGILFVAADNDTYPPWYVQQVESFRADVTVIAVPLLPADWYRAELRRRDGLLSAESVAAWPGLAELLAEIAGSARAKRRPLAASPTVSPRHRRHLAAGWTLSGFVYLADAPPGDATGGAEAVARRAPRVDSAAAREALTWRASRLPAAAPRDGIDPVARQLRRLLDCPRLALEAGTDEGAAGSLDSVCNFR